MANVRKMTNTNKNLAVKVPSDGTCFTHVTTSLPYAELTLDLIYLIYFFDHSLTYFHWKIELKTLVCLSCKNIRNGGKNS